MFRRIFVFVALCLYFVSASCDAMPNWGGAKVDTFQDETYIYDEVACELVGVTPVRYIKNDKEIMFLNFHCSTPGEHIFFRNIIITTDNDNYNIDVDSEKKYVYVRDASQKDECYRMIIDETHRGLIEDICNSKNVVITYIGKKTMTRKLSAKQLLRFKSVVEYKMQ